MGRGRGFRFFVVGASIFFALAKVALSYAQGSPARPSKDLSVWDISIPPKLGYILETHQPTSAVEQNPGISNPGVIVHIQDAHTNYEAQQSIVQILDGLVERYGLKLILVEGSEGDVSLAYLRRYGPPENRKQVGEKYLKAGIISAEEYLDIVSDYPLTIWGVENQSLYDQNVEMFLIAESLQESLKPVTLAVRRTADELAPKLSSSTLTELEEKARGFEQHTVSLADYVDVLSRAAKDAKLSYAGFPALERFVEVRGLEQTIQLPTVQQEQQALIGRLSQAAGEADLENLVAKAKGLKDGSVKRLEFYTFLDELAASSKVGLDAYPTLAQYIRYVKLSDQISPRSLSDEIGGFAAELRRSLPASPESRQLTRLLEEVDLVEKLVDLRLSPEEYQRLQGVALEDILPRWEQFLSDQRAKYGLAVQPLPQVTDLQEQLAKLQRFYQAADERDNALVTNAIAKLRESGQPLAVLITGGFHSPHITQMLREQGVGTVVLTPKVTQPTNERLYRAVVKYKSGHGSFDEVMAIANPTETATPQEASR